ncbi:hypothetical protein HII13_000001 [Brettanomyces bruxellensis]|nr:hypothetical protein HII13_000001 [Brettanomyces bruxellensis]
MEQSLILRLPEDILVFHVVKYLELKDIKNLFLTCKQLSRSLNCPTVWHVIYMKTFAEAQDENYSFEMFYKWGPAMYKQRKHSVLKLFGSNSFGRLGCTRETYNNSKYEIVNGQRRYYGTFQMTSQSGYADISAGGFSFEILGIDGTLSFTGYDWHGRLGRIAPGLKGERIGTIQAARPRNPINTVQALYWKTLPRFTAVSSGRAHFLALDSDNNLWTWDDGHVLLYGEHLTLWDGIIDKEIKGKILKIRAGWNLNSCMVAGVGIVVWSYRTVNNSLTKAYVRILPRTNENYIFDYVLLESAVIMIDRHGILKKIDFSGLNLDEISSENVHLPPTVVLDQFMSYIKTNGSSRFIRLSGCYETFAVISEGDDVLIGKRGRMQFKLPLIMASLKQKSIITVAAGDYHFLALDNKGQVYSWGRESMANNCLGLGKLTTILSKGIGYMDGKDLVVPDPQPIQVSGRVLAIAAAGWHSALIVAPNAPDSDNS